MANNEIASVSGLAEIVANAFLADIIANGSKSTNSREGIWENLANTNTVYSDKIIGFRRVLNRGYQNEAQVGPISMFFLLLKDRNAATLLKYLTISRIRKPDPNDAIGSGKIADEIAQEMGFKNIHDEGLINITLTKVVEKILSGEVMIKLE